MYRLKTIELVRLLKSFIGKEWDGYSKNEKIEWIKSYRKVEDENEIMIMKYGSVEKWYESGEGRLLNLS